MPKMSQNPAAWDRVASAILRDVPIAMGRARPDGERLPFDWLEPAFGDDVFSPLIDRLVNAYHLAEPDVQQLTREGLLLAIDRAATTWLGAERTLLLLDWVHEIAFESMPAPRWITLLFHRNLEDAAETAYWVREIVERLSRWGINAHALLQQAEAIPDLDWVRLVMSAGEQDRVDVAVWLLSLLRPRPAVCRSVWNAVVKPWKAKLPELPTGYGDWIDDIVDPLSMAAQCPGFALEDYGNTTAARRRGLAAYAGNDDNWLEEYGDTTAAIEFASASTVAYSAAEPQAA